MRGTLFVISAPSGAGKTTLAAPLTRRIERLVFSVSFTTRSPRAGETDGVDYHFVDRETFRRMVDEGAFLEWAEVHGHLYGTSRAATLEQLEQGRDVLLDIDVQGAAQIRASGFASFSVFILPPSYDELRARLARRGTESAEELARRLANAAREVREYVHFDAVIVNEDRERAAAELEQLVREVGERRRRQLARAERIVAGFPEPPGPQG
ncbi:MAG: guanylate kinase [Acidobacteriota bacterium]|nr:MAG: guanylate kinase [Acidobacteriota bacterium]